MCEDVITYQVLVVSSCFSRYAFILYNDKRQAAIVVDHAEQYHINDQPLAVSFYFNEN
jgi:hypothetical protein